MNGSRKQKSYLRKLCKEVLLSVSVTSTEHGSYFTLPDGFVHNEAEVVTQHHSWCGRGAESEAPVPQGTGHVLQSKCACKTVLGHLGSIL